MNVERPRWNVFRYSPSQITNIFLSAFDLSRDDPPELKHALVRVDRIGRSTAS